jgi:hypothetical protein
VIVISVSSVVVTSSRLRPSSGHFATRFRAATTHVSAALHHLVVTELVTVLRARFTHLCTDLTGTRMVFGAEEHEARARVADLGAGNQHPDVVRVGVLPAQFEAVADGFEADRLATLAAIDTLLHCVTHLMWHRDSPCGIAD